MAASTSGAIGAKKSTPAPARGGACAAGRSVRARTSVASAAAVFTGGIQYILSAVITLARSTQGFFRGILHAAPTPFISRRARRVVRCRTGERRGRANGPGRRHRQGRCRSADQGRDGDG